MTRSFNSIKHNSFLFVFLNSTSLFVISYLVMDLIFNISTCLVASRFYYIESVLYYFGIVFSIADGNPLWTVESVTTIYFTGPFFTLFLFGATFLKLFSYFRDEESIQKLFFLWGFINALNLFLGGFLTGLITKRGFGYFATWNYFSVELRKTNKKLLCFILLKLLVIRSAFIIRYATF